MWGATTSSGPAAVHDGTPSPLWSTLMRLLPAPLPGALRERPRLRRGLGLLALLASFVFADTVVLRLGALPEASYFEPSLALELARSLGLPRGLVAAAVLAVLAIFGGLRCSWDSLGGKPLRGFVVFVAAVTAWPLLTDGYNLYFDQPYWLDKALVVALLALLCWRPAWVLPLAALLTALLWQHALPQLGGSVLAHKLQLLHVLNLFAAMVLLHALTGATRRADFVFLVCCMVAGSYFAAGMAKVELRWWDHTHLHLTLVSAYAHGWLDFLGADRVGAFAEALRPVEPVMRWSVLVVELGAVLLLLHRRLTLTLLALFVLFHLGVLALYGFFFWTWMLLDLALMVLLLRTGDPARELALGRPATLLLSFVLIATAFQWARPPWLGWFDTTLTYTYRVEALDEAGSRHLLRPEFFTPYEDVFTMTPFAYTATGHRVLTSSYGVTKDVAVARALAGAETAQAVLAVEEALGEPRHDAARTARLRDFLRRYVASRNAHGGRPFALSAITPPAQFLSHRAGIRDTGPARVTELRMVEVTTWFDGRAPRAIRVQEVMRVPVGPP